MILNKNIYIIIDNINIFEKKSYLENISDILFKIKLKINSLTFIYKLKLKIANIIFIFKKAEKFKIIKKIK